MGVVVFGLPYPSAAAVVSQYGDALHGKVVIDITNPAGAALAISCAPELPSG